MIVERTVLHVSSTHEEYGNLMQLIGFIMEVLAGASCPATEKPTIDRT